MHENKNALITHFPEKFSYKEIFIASANPSANPTSYKATHSQSDTAIQ